MKLGVFDSLPAVSDHTACSNWNVRLISSAAFDSRFSFMALPAMEKSVSLLMFKGFVYFLSYTEVITMQQNSKLVLNCSCGGVELHIAGSPAVCAYCHCTSCRDFYGLPVLAATAWKNENVQVVKGCDQIGKYQHPTKQMQRYFCSACGETVFGTNRLGLTVVRTSRLARSSDGSLPADFHPKFHLFYGSRELDVSDELPKYLEERGGPLFSESELQRT
jgi:hypothetical protein